MKTQSVLTVMSCLLGSVFVFSQAAGTTTQGGPEKQAVATAIPGIVAGGTKVERVWTGDMSADGLISMPDGTLLLPEQGADRISKVDKNGKITPFLEDTNETGAVAICQIRDVGPWMIDDEDYVMGIARPIAEPAGSTIPYGKNEGKKSNGAGIDVTPAAAALLGIEGMGTVHWRFVDDEVA